MNITLFFATIVLLCVCAGCKQAGTIPSGPKPTEKSRCAYDIKRCEDGNFVGRSGSSCQFICPEPSSK